MCYMRILFFFFQAEDGIRDAQESRGLGDVYKRQGGLKGLQDSCAEVYNHIVAVFNAVNGLMDPSVNSAERYKRAEKIAASHTQVNDLFFPSEYYAQIFHSDARRLSAAIKNRKAMELRYNLTMDILRAIGDSNKPEVLKAAEAARTMNMAMEMRAAHSVAGMMDEMREAKAASEQHRRECEQSQRTLREAESAARDEKSKLVSEVERLKNKLGGETAELARSRKRITGLEAEINELHNRLKDAEVEAHERVARTMEEAEEALQEEHQGRVQNATEWANREQDAKQLATKRLFEVDSERREMVQLMVAEREARRVVEQKLQRIRTESEAQADRVEELERAAGKQDGATKDLVRQLEDAREASSKLQQTIVAIEAKRNQLDDDLRVERKWRERLDSELAEAMRLGEGEDVESRKDVLQRLIERHAEGERAACKRADEAERRLSQVTHDKAAVDQELKIQQQAWEEVMEEHVRLQMTISQLKSELDAGQMPEGAKELVSDRCILQKLSLIHISEPTRLLSISYAVFCLKKKK
eukprot:TRINITY_DN15002_c0_g1_i4.p1 TRINITY_DN15002_c0_g1~~TRINITY_DN15002_c0_g1_i4.p1  ORF type:complete len:530 (+),score=198.98 TRINITY_DN15002_c0_g1_i4:21-1610(+)